MNYRKYFVLLEILVFVKYVYSNIDINSVAIEKNQDNISNETEFIYEQQQDYWRLEQSLWDNIKYREYDTDFEMLDKIRVMHLNFLSRNFHEHAIALNLFNHSDEILFDSLNAINISVKIAKSEYLNDYKAITNELKTILIAQDHLSLEKQMNYFYDYFTSNDAYFKNVSVQTKTTTAVDKNFKFTI